MATTRPVPHQQNRGEGAPAGGVKPKNMVAGQGKNQRALKDIGNLVTIRGVDGKPLPQVSRPVTRSFCAQLLANAQAAAETKKPLAVKGEGKIMIDGAAGKARVPKLPVQKKKVVTANPTLPVIEISPDTDEVAIIEKPVSKGKSIEDVSHKKKKPQSLTSTLTARSKAACGIANRPKEQIVDIDALDADNELAVVEYVEDIYNFYKLAENESRVHDYIRSQPEINEKIRAILIDWLIEVHNKFELLKETLYLTINILDRFLAAETVLRRELQLVGMSAMLLASKYEEIWAPEVNDFVCISDRAYTHDQVLKMEKRILGTLEWTLTVPTPYVFLVRFIKASVPQDSNVENMVYFLAELGIMNYATIKYCPSMIAASAVYAARSTLNISPVWNDTLKLHTGFSESQLIECAKLLVGFHSMAVEDKLQVIFRKYSKSERGVVALMPPAKALLPAAAAQPSS